MSYVNLKRHNIRVVSLSCVQGLTEDYSLETATELALRKLLQRDSGQNQFMYDFWLGNTYSQVYILVKDYF